MLILDCECYPNYFLLAFLEVSTGKVRHFECTEAQPFDGKTVAALMAKYQTGSFNGLSYDLPLIVAAIMGAKPARLKSISDAIILRKQPAWRVMRDFELAIPAKWDHIDIIEVAPGQSGLKIYGGRMHAPTLQDLPIEPDEHVTPEQMEQLKAYCANDLHLTAGLFRTLRPQLDLRVSMSKQYGQDLRSKSDAQIAETVILSELSKVTGTRYRAPQTPDGYGFSYKDPGFLEFQTPELRATHSRILSERFTLSAYGQVQMPQWLRDAPIEFGGAKYQLGIGGIHSCEKSQFVRATGGWIIEDRDVASYYPNIILGQSLYPGQLGREFTRVYQSIVDRRIRAKREGDKVTADSLKLSINGSFGKLGSKYSALYSPDLLIQVTVTGQLALLMLIERLHLAGVRCISANTDGVVLHYPESLAPTVESICFDWSLSTSYTLEATQYRAIGSRDVNNYVAVTTGGKVKGKGCFAQSGLAKNPDGQIIYKAVAAQVAQGVPYKKTIRECEDIREFVAVRRVQGGAVWRGEKLGRAVRFYISTSVPENECILYATNSNRVPKSAGAKPCMVLPEQFPDDVDYRYYETEAEKLLCEIGWKE